MLEYFFEKNKHYSTYHTVAFSNDWYIISTNRSFFHCAVGFHYNKVQYNMTWRTCKQFELTKDAPNKSHPHIRGMECLLVRVLEKMNHVIMPSHCVLLLSGCHQGYPSLHSVVLPNVLLFWMQKYSQLSSNTNGVVFCVYMTEWGARSWEKMCGIELSEDYYASAFRRRRHYVFGLSVRPKPEIPSFDLYMGPLVHPINRDHFTAYLSVRRGFRAFARSQRSQPNLAVSGL